MPRPGSRSARLAVLCCGLLAASSTPAQYVFDPSAADEIDKPGVLFFGAARDERGKPVPDVLVVLEDIGTSYTLVTDALGRYRARLPLDATLASVTANCSRPGYVALKVTKRKGSRRPAGPTVQLDCVLRRTAAG